MSWDIYSKLLLKECPQDFVTYFVPGAIYVGMREAQLQTRGNSPFDPREMRGDGMIEAHYGERAFLIDVEWQSTKDNDMAERLLEYSHEATRLHKLPVLSCVIYTQKVAKVPCAPLTRAIPQALHEDDRPVLWFDYESLEICECTVEDLRGLNLDGFYPLMLLCKDGATYEVLEEVLQRLRRHGSSEMISITRFFAGKLFQDKKSQQQVKEQFMTLRELFEDSWTFQETLEEGRKEGLKEGRVEGLEDGLVKGQRRSIETVAQARFPELMMLVTGKITTVNDEEKLQKILSILSTSQTVQEVVQSLFTLG